MDYIVRHETMSGPDVSRLWAHYHEIDDGMLTFYTFEMVTLFSGSAPVEVRHFVQAFPIERVITWYKAETQTGEKTDGSNG